VAGGTPDREVLVFLKAPRSGEVKTRLAAEIGDDLAVEIYRGLTAEVLRATEAAGSPTFSRIVCFAPRGAEEEIAAWLGDHHVLEPQSDGDLGARIEHAFATSFARGSSKTVIVGTDSLSIDRAAVGSAFASLDDADLVLRAAEDGGYTLIGLKQSQAALFTGIAWSTSLVLKETLARAAARGLRAVVEGPDADIDTLEDLRKNWSRIRPCLDPQTIERVGQTAFFARPA